MQGVFNTVYQGFGQMVLHLTEQKNVLSRGMELDVKERVLHATITSCPCECQSNQTKDMLTKHVIAGQFIFGSFLETTATKRLQNKWTYLFEVSFFLCTAVS